MAPKIASAHADPTSSTYHPLAPHPTCRLHAVEGVTIYGPPPTAALGRASLASFNVEGVHATDICMILDTCGVAVRSGHHCTQPLHRCLGVSASARASAYIYNTPQEVDAFVSALQEAVAMFR